MGKHTGVVADPGKRGRTVRAALGIVATLAAWAILVYYAIQLGSQVRSGDSGAWALLAVAAAGAACCLFLCLLLSARLLDEVRAERAARPPRATGGRRAKR